MTLLTIESAAIPPLWEELNLKVKAGEFIAVLGPNGAGKSTLLRAILGTRKLHRGRINTSARIGYIPQQQMFPTDLPLRSYDLVSLALSHGLTGISRTSKAEVLALLDYVGATGIAYRRVGTLSGGQQQLIRQAQALATNPELLLLDEPLLSLDPAVQATIVSLLNQRRRDHGTSIIFVTHNINPVLDCATAVLYLGPQGHSLGPVEEVMTTETLSALYGYHVEVIEAGGRLVVI